MDDCTSIISSVRWPELRFVCRSLCWRRQPNLAAERLKARIVLVAQDEGVIEENLDARIAVGQGPIKPLEGRLGIVAQRIDLGDLVGRNARMLVDQRPESRIGRAPVATDLACEGERGVLNIAGRLLLRGGE